jgi:hypothetical protein
VALNPTPVVPPPVEPPIAIRLAAPPPTDPDAPMTTRPPGE